MAILKLPWERMTFLKLPLERCNFKIAMGTHGDFKINAWRF